MFHCVEEHVRRGIGVFTITQLIISAIN
ncbi:BnaC09g31520D [Brassica napus]|uniref:BnaC09g31520D protein n=1 Tax=Brassica napus TaxID=3708 RepID=A0A078G3F4_BRANA|nr:BnaC09g31520D [Brassica napus]